VAALENHCSRSNNSTNIYKVLVGWLVSDHLLLSDFKPCGTIFKVCVCVDVTAVVIKCILGRTSSRCMLAG
jgi:hypothetical protein